LLLDLMYERQASGHSDWSGVLYGLEMAASIEDVFADTGYVEDPMTFAVCEPVIDFQAGRSEIASKYVAAASIFNFLWMAYEASVAEVRKDEFRGLLKAQRLGERGRRLLERREYLAPKIGGFSQCVRPALIQCQNGGLMQNRVLRVREKFPANGLATAAELCREFRNFVFHGEDEVPTHRDWGSSLVEMCRIYRFYSVSRILMMLIQVLAYVELEGDWEDEDRERRPDDLFVIHLR